MYGVLVSDGPINLIDRLGGSSKLSQTIVPSTEEFPKVLKVYLVVCLIESDPARKILKYIFSIINHLKGVDLNCADFSSQYLKTCTMETQRSIFYQRYSANYRYCIEND